MVWCWHFSCYLRFGVFKVRHVHGYAPGHRWKGRVRKDAHFTPPPLPWIADLYQLTPRKMIQKIASKGKVDRLSMNECECQMKRLQKIASFLYIKFPPSRQAWFSMMFLFPVWWDVGYFPQGWLNMTQKFDERPLDQFGMIDIDFYWWRDCGHVFPLSLGVFFKIRQEKVGGWITQNASNAKKKLAKWSKWGYSGLFVK